MPTSKLFAIAAGLVLAGCVHVPPGPSVMVLPGTDKNLEEFQADDAVCRQWAAVQTGISPNRASNDTAVAGAAVGTVLGAATGAAIGAASGNPATGAAVGAGAGLLGGTLVGASNADEARWTMQRRYDMAYLQCMYARGNQIPVPRGSHRRPASVPIPRARNAPDDLPPPPRGAPPPPPPGWSP